MLGNLGHLVQFGKTFPIYLGNIPALEETVTQIRSTLFTVELGLLQTDVL